MTVYSIINPLPVILGKDGKPLNGGKVYIGVAGQDPETNPITVYWDAAGTVVAAQPLGTIGGYVSRAGSPAQVFAPDDYSVRVRDRFGVQVFYAPTAHSQLGDFIASLASTAPGKGASLIGTEGGGTAQDYFDYLGKASLADVKNENTAPDNRIATVQKSWALVRTVVEQFDIRQSQFAGGAPLNGVDDDAPAFRAALAYLATLGGRYTGGCAQLTVPRGIVRFDSASPTLADACVDLTTANNIAIVGQGDGATTIKGSQNLAMFKAVNGINAAPGPEPLYRLIMRDMTLEGPGYVNEQAHGLWLGPTNNCLFQDMRIWATRTAASWCNSFHTEFINMRMNGLFSLANYDGFYARDGDLTVQENAVGIYGGRVQGSKRYGFRGENVTGSSVFGLEVLGCEYVGVHLGESPGGHDLKWFTWVGGLIDTCPDLLIVKKGTSNLAELLHFSGMWMGYAYEPLPGAGIGVDFNGLTDCTFAADIIANTTYAARLTDCTNITLSARTIRDYDRISTGSAAILLENSSRCRVDVGTTKKLSVSPSTTALLESGTSNRNLITGVFDGLVTTVGAQSNKTLVVT